jgi:hypothetical protein
MRFIEASADVPDQLIREVNEGEVVFLCGAGVSRGVGLPSFQTLTDQVYTKLGESRGNEAAERIAYDRSEYDRALRSLEKRTLLPRTASRVRIAVSELLAPPDGADLSRHLSLLRLSRDRAGQHRLLTTNFDTLFERAAHRDDTSIVSHAGKSIPRPGGQRDYGILHLHGRLADDSLKLEETDLILTSADFGDAYLRDGWASRYVEDRMRLNTLVLVGYAAEDAALGVLAGWKMAPVYCRAVLCYDQRVTLDGAPAEVVDAAAKDLATKQLAKLAARKAAKKVAKPAAPAAVVKPAPAPTPPPETPEQLRARVRAALLRRSA